jgi:hypothetical protein
MWSIHPHTQRDLRSQSAYYLQAVAGWPHQPKMELVCRGAPILQLCVSPYNQQSGAFHQQKEAIHHIVSPLLNVDSETCLFQQLYDNSARTPFLLAF